VLSRALCLHARFPVPKDLAPAKREGALRLKVMDWSPYAVPGVLFDWGEGEAGVWIWDRLKVEEAIREAGLDPKRVTVLPETVLAEPGLSGGRLSGGRLSGARLLAGLEGYEGQAWRAGGLVASRWWPEPPQAEEWRRFERAAGLPPELQSAEPPAAEAASWRRDPWARPRANWLALVQEAGPLRLGLAAAAVMLLPLAYEGAALARLSLKTAEAQARLTELGREAAPILSARGAALAALDCVRALLQLDPYPSQISLLAKVGAQLPPNGTALGDWSFQNGEVRFTLTHPSQLDSLEYVRRFEALQLFERVRAEPQGDGRLLVVQAKVKPQWP
jgi:hypothetical protein